MKIRKQVAVAGFSLAQLWAAPVVAASPDQAAQAFLGQYNYCDAKILASAWESETYEAKVRAGQKLPGDKAVVEEFLTQGRAKGTTCQFAETPFAYEDAEALSKHWKVSVEQAKAALAEKITTGNRDLANQVVAEAKKGGAKDAGKKVNKRKAILNRGKALKGDKLNTGGLKKAAPKAAPAPVKK